MLDRGSGCGSVRLPRPGHCRLQEGQGHDRDGARGFRGPAHGDRAEPADDVQRLRRGGLGHLQNEEAGDAQPALPDHQPPAPDERLASQGPARGVQREFRAPLRRLSAPRQLGWAAHDLQRRIRDPPLQRPLGALPQQEGEPEHRAPLQARRAIGEKGDVGRLPQLRHDHGGGAQGDDLPGRGWQAGEAAGVWRTRRTPERFQYVRGHVRRPEPHRSGARVVSSLVTA
mmetsp:Transcript_32209/g.86205  ORF Transcript_32209/g.86205 Transcript_32209/m.86205 type:complete len:228 (+) Transcript_32209:657-1340(+)